MHGKLVRSNEEINGSKKKYMFEIKTKGGWKVITVDPTQELFIEDPILVNKNTLEVEGLTPIEYILL